MSPEPSKRTVKRTVREPSDGAAAPPSSEPYGFFQALCDETGADEAAATKSEKSKQLGIAKTLIADGVTEADVRGCIRYLQSQSWRTAIIDLSTVRSEIGKWRMAGRPAAEPLPIAGARASPTPPRSLSRTEEHQAKVRRALEIAEGRA